MDDDSRSRVLSEFEDFRKKNKEHTYLVYYMRKLLDDCVISKNGIIEPIDWSGDTLLEESFNIMMEVEYVLSAKENLERLLKREGLDTSELENIDITKGYDIFEDDHEFGVRPDGWKQAGVWALDHAIHNDDNIQAIYKMTNEKLQELWKK